MEIIVFYLRRTALHPILLNQVNLAGRQEFREAATELRGELKQAVRHYQ